MSLRRTSALIAASVLTITVVQQPPASGRPSAAARDDGGPRVVHLGHGDRVAVTEVGDTGRRVLQALPRDDGSEPGLLVSSGDRGTTVETVDGTSEPAVVDGDAPPAAPAADLVELDLDAIARDGRPAAADVMVFDVESGAVQSFRRIPGDDGAPCTTDSWAISSCLLVPEGRYSVMAFVYTNPAAVPATARQRTVQNVSLVGEPEVTITGDREVTFDARLAREVTVATPGRRTEVTPGGAMQVGYTRTAANGRTVRQEVRPAATLDETFFMQPTAAVSTGGFGTLTRLRLAAPDIELEAPGGRALHPEYYEPVWFSDVSSDFPVYDGHARLRVVDVGHATQADLAGKDLDGAVAVAERSDDLSVADQSNAAARAGAALVVIRNDGPGDNDDPNGTGTKLLAPTVRLSRAEGLALTSLPGRARVGVRGESASPYLYDLVLEEDGRVPDDLSYAFGTDDLATQVRGFHGQPSIGSTFSEAAYAWQPGDTFAISTMFPFRGGARTRVEYRIPDPDTRWSYAVATPETRYNALFPEEPVLRMLLSSPGTEAYTAGSTTDLPVGAAPVTPGPNPARPMERAGDRMRVAIDGFIDADGNHGTAYSTDSGMRTLLQIRADGELVAETDNLPSGIAALPPGPSQVEVAFRTDNPQSWAQLSTHTDTTWTFPSDTVAAGAVAQPVILADYDVDVDLRNRVRTAGPVSFDLGLDHAAGSSTAPIQEVSVQASYDDGASWRAATVTLGRDGVRHVELPRGNGFVSLRLHAADTAGSALDQTVIRAFRVGR